MYAKMSYDQSEDKAQNHHGRASVHDNLQRVRTKKIIIIINIQTVCVCVCVKKNG